MKTKTNFGVCCPESSPMGSDWIMTREGLLKKKGLHFYMPKTVGKTEKPQRVVFINRNWKATA